MYIEFRKSAIYAKDSEWKKEEKKIKTTSIYLGSDFPTALATLPAKVKPGSAILEEFPKLQKEYHQQVAINSLTDILVNFGIEEIDPKKNNKKRILAPISEEADPTIREIAKLLKKLTDTRDKCDEKAQSKLPPKSYFTEDTISQIKKKDKSQENGDQTVISFDDDKSQYNENE